MFPARRFARFVVGFLLLYGLLVLPWPGVRESYASFFRAGGNVLFKSFGSRGTVRFIPADPQHGKWDTEGHLIRRDRPTYWRVGFNSRRMGYLPTAVLTALVLATPIPWRRRGWALLWGILLVNGFVVVRLAVAIMRGFRNVDLFVFSSFWNRAVDTIYDVVSISTVTSCVVPAVIWMLVCLRREDCAVLLESPAVSSSAGSA